jgi:hypothetical protein
MPSYGSSPDHLEPVDPTVTVGRGVTLEFVSGHG